MIEGPGARFLALVRRDLQEYRTSLCWTPLVLVLLLAGFMLGAVLFANQISALGEAVSQVIPQEGEPGGRVSIRIDEGPGGEPSVEYRVEKPFTPYQGGEDAPEDGADETTRQLPAGSLNPLLQSVHNLFLLVLILVCANYLLATLFTDRRDRSILFWKSMPVSDREDVLAKFTVAMVVAPAIYVTASLLAQFAGTLLGMLLLWRMEMDPYALVLSGIDVRGLVSGQLGGWLLMTLWLAPTYAWLMLASAAARRSPFMAAVGPLLAFMLGERILLGSSHLATILSRHVPHYAAGSYAGFSWGGPQDLVQMGLGLLFAAVALWIAVFLRRNYFEL
jgi:hypothetical protein